MVNENERRARAISLGHLIVRLQKERGLSQGQLAKFAKVNRTWLSRIQHGSIFGVKGPNPAMLMRVAIALKVDPYQFWRELGVMEVDLLREHPDAFSPDTVHFALWLETLTPEERQAITNAFRSLQTVAERMAAKITEEAVTPIPAVPLPQLPRPHRARQPRERGTPCLVHGSW